jgi:hypothetical protein
MKYTVVYREHPNGIQWEEEYPTKEQADKKAYNVYINGGIAVVISTPPPQPFPSTQKDQDDQDLF